MKQQQRIKFISTLIILLGFFLNPPAGYGQKIIPVYGNLPVLLPDRSRLFYLQRTIDRNTLIYQANYNPDGKINEKKPVKAHWIDFDDGGKISPLTFMQNSFAYGIESTLIDKQKKIFLVHLVAYKKIDLYMEPGKDQQYRIYMIISGIKMALSRIIVNITGGTYLKPVVSSIEFTGNDLKNGKEVTEKIYPR